MWSGLLYFVLFAGKCIPGRFIPLFYKLHSQTPSQIGLILGIYSFASLISTPIICHKADSLNRRHSVLIITRILFVLFFILQSLSFLNFFNHQHTLKFVFLVVVASVASVFDGPSYSLVTAIELEKLGKQFGESDAPLMIGKARLYGAISWSIFSAFLGVVLDHVHGDTSRSFAVYIMAFFATVAFVITVYVDERFADYHLQTEIENETSKHKRKLENVDDVRVSLTSENFELIGDVDSSADLKVSSSGIQEDTQTSKSMGVKAPMSPTSNIIDNKINDDGNTDNNSIESELSLLRAIRPVMCSGGVWTLLFFNLVFWLGVGMSVVENLLFIFFTEDLKASYTLCGLSVVITVIFEIPMFAQADNMQRKIGSPKLMVVGALAYCIRVVGYSFVPNAWHVLLLEPLHGVTYAAVHAASVSIVAKKAAGRKYQATAQAVLDFVTGVGIVFGSIVGGFIIEAMGSRFMYRVCAAFVVGAAFAFIIVVFLVGDDAVDMAMDEQEASREMIGDQVSSCTIDAPDGDSMDIEGDTSSVNTSNFIQAEVRLGRIE